MPDAEIEGSEELLPVEAAEPLPTPAADALEQELRPRLGAEAEGDLYRLILADHAAAKADRQEWEGKLALWDEQYYGILPDKAFPWPGCANFNAEATVLPIAAFSVEPVP